MKAVWPQDGHRSATEPGCNSEGNQGTLGRIGPILTRAGVEGVSQAVTD
jgi:hypothetical protein